METFSLEDMRTKKFRMKSVNELFTEVLHEKLEFLSFKCFLHKEILASLLILRCVCDYSERVSE